MGQGGSQSCLLNYERTLLCVATQAGRSNNRKAPDEMQRVNLCLLPREPGDLCSSTWCSAGAHTQSGDAGTAELSPC